MHIVTSFHASHVEPETLNAVMAQYISVERARVIRQLLVRRLGALALIPVVLGPVLHRLTAFAAWASISILVTPPVWAWVVELRRTRALDRRLASLPSTESWPIPAGE